MSEEHKDKVEHIISLIKKALNKPRKRRTQ
jgi:hypothetical protein